MTWLILNIFIAYLVGRWAGLLGVRVVVGVVVGVVVLGALVLVPTIMEAYLRAPGRVEKAAGPRPAEVKFRRL
jgi:hypothetical protein